MTQSTEGLVAIRPTVPDLRLPIRDRPHGPLVAARLRRTTLGYLLVATLGALPVVLDASPAWQAFGLGVIAPGGGWLYAGSILFAVITVVLMLVALFAWFGAGMIVAPPLVWLGSAGLAAAFVGDTWDWARVAVPVLAVVALVGGQAAGRLGYRAARRRGAARNAYLSTLRVDVDPRPLPETRELSERELGVQRYLLNVALQPIDGFEGFDIVDQFQTAAIRYQINFAQWALALAAYDHTPAFLGYSELAQRQLVQKTLNKRVWSYWKWENLWGNLSLDPDPISRDNIMLSGYIGLMAGLYETVTGDTRFDEPGTLTFVHDERRRYSHDHTSITSAVHHNFVRSPWGMFPCEPNWIYTACNAIGVNCLVVHDRLHGTTYADDVVDRFATSMDEEFLTADGRVTAIRSSRLGLTIPSLTSTMADAGTVWLSNPIVPVAARRLWEIVRHELLRVEDGRIHMSLRGWDKIDVGNYKPSDVSAHAMVMMAAAEMGDDDIVDAANASLEAVHTPDDRDGMRRYDASLQAHGMLLLARSNRRDGLRDLVTRGRPPAVAAGPVLAEAPYPDCLVARAATDGRALDLVLRPGNGAGRVRLRLGRLVPGTSYAVRGGVTREITADAHGAADLEVDLDGRTEVTVHP
ncbi:MAG: hypothetical protein KY469_13140 [Actinobacteria bacterium]|nr:hypothetical protein [Actinomycetota bacterium]